MDRRKFSAVGEEQHKEKGKDIAHGGTPPFRNRVVAYMKKELHRHRENAGAALELLYGVEKKKLSSFGFLYTY